MHPRIRRETVLCVFVLGHTHRYVTKKKHFDTLDSLGVSRVAEVEVSLRVEEQVADWVGFMQAAGSISFNRHTYEVYHTFIYTPPPLAHLYISYTETTTRTLIHTYTPSCISEGVYPYQALTDTVHTYMYSCTETAHTHVCKQ